MPRMMIAEDNTMTRQGLMENIPWVQYGIEAVAVGNGRDALELLKTQQYDLIVTDIVMPFVSGLDLAKEAKLLYPGIKIIIISAHDQFEYAQTALKTGAYDFIIKPVDYNNLLNSVKNAILEKQQEEIFRNQVKMSIPLLRERFLLQLVEEQSSEYIFMEDSKYLELKFKNVNYLCVLFEIDNIKQVKKKLNMENYSIHILKIKESVKNVFETVGFEAWVFQLGNDCLASIIGFDAPESTDLISAIHEKLEVIRKETEKRCEFTLTIGIGKIVSSISNIASSYRKAQDALEYKFLLGNNQVLDIKDLEFIESHDSLHFPLSIEEKLIKKALIGNSEEVLKCSKELEEYFRENSADKEYVKTIVLGILSKLYQLLFESGIKNEKIILSRTKAISQIEGFCTSEELFPWFEEVVLKICGEVEGCMQKQHQQIISEVKDYVVKEYMKEELGLNDVARAIGISPSYLSTMFKKKTGTNLGDYIISVRMEAAQKLLMNTELRIAEVAAQVGYSNQYYFSASFKKYVKCTPIEFRSIKKAN